MHFDYARADILITLISIHFFFIPILTVIIIQWKFCYDSKKFQSDAIECNSCKRKETDINEINRIQ